MHTCGNAENTAGATCTKPAGHMDRGDGPHEDGTTGCAWGTCQPIVRRGAGLVDRAMSWD